MNSELAHAADKKPSQCHRPAYKRRSNQGDRNGIDASCVEAISKEEGRQKRYSAKDKEDDLGESVSPHDATIDLFCKDRVGLRRQFDCAGQQVGAALRGITIGIFRIVRHRIPLQNHGLFFSRAAGNFQGEI